MKCYFIKTFDFPWDLDRENFCCPSTSTGVRNTVGFTSLLRIKYFHRCNIIIIELLHLFFHKLRLINVNVINASLLFMFYNLKSCL